MIDGWTEKENVVNKVGKVLLCTYYKDSNRQKRFGWNKNRQNFGGTETSSLLLFFLFFIFLTSGVKILLN